MWPFKPKHKDSIEVRASARAVLDLLDSDTPRKFEFIQEGAGCQPALWVGKILVIPKVDPDEFGYEVELRSSPNVYALVTDKDLVTPLRKWVERYRDQQHAEWVRESQERRAKREQALLDILDPRGAR
jgi:hypothetical protein